jgi:hypothetical protein
MRKWLSLRIRAQREVMCRLMLPPRCELERRKEDSEDIVGDARKICLIVVDLEDDEDWVR